jgi:tetratricopeptide (TPR) repeat protein/HEAT repeat protein
MTLALSRPGEQFPLERLVELYRQRDGTLDKLVEELTARAEKAGPEHYAALIALAGAFRHDAEHDRAASTYERAIAEAPKNPTAILALGRLLLDRGDKAGAKARFEEARPYVQNDADEEQLLRSLMSLSLDLKDFDAARRHHEELVKRAKGSFFARAELARELFSRSEFERAEAEYKELSKAAAGDNRALAPALRGLGLTLTRQGKNKEALDVLKKALDAAGGQSGLRREVLDSMVEVHRASGGVASLIAVLEKERAEDFERLSLLAGLYEEVGRVDDALSTYRRALRKRDDIATRQRVVALLEVSGKLDEAIREYQALIHASPHDSEFVFRLAEALIQRGERRAAIAEVEKLEARSAGDDDTLAGIVDFYERVEEQSRAMALLDRLSKTGQSDPRHIIDLGDRYYRQGDAKRAVEVWDRIKVVVRDRPKALLTLGEVLLEHDMSDKALELLRQAAELSPKETKYKRALALALERVTASASSSRRNEQHDEARRIWEKVLEGAGTDKNAAREARQHIVTLWALDDRLGRVDDRLNKYARPLEVRLAQKPPDLEAGRLLGEVYTRLRRPADAERALKVVVANAPGDQEAYLALERALVLERKLPDAIRALEHLTKVDPRRAREYFQRMAQYSAELYRDEDAIRYASKAVELSPDDAEGHRKLGDMFRRRQDVEHAMVEFRLAIAKNDRLFPVYFDLAELLITRGEVEEADRLLRRVVRAAPDDDLVGRAARLSMQVNLGRGSLESLERELLPVVLGNPARPLYRRLLVEVYDNLAFPYVHEAKSSDPARAGAARDALRRIGERAVKPLLDALGDERDSQQRTAIELLSHISNRGAGPALVAYATGKADGELRTRAMIAVGALRDPELLPRLSSVIAPAGSVRIDETDTVAIAAAWCVARMQNPRARPLLIKMLTSDAPSVRALGSVGLGLLPNRADARALGAIVGSPENEPRVRAAAAFALGAIGGEQALDVLARQGDAQNTTLRAMAVLGLARLRAPAARRAVAAGLVSAEPALRDAAAAAAYVVSTGEYRLPPEPLPLPSGRVDTAAVVLGLRPSGYTPDERAKAIVDIAPDLAASALTAVHATPEGARAIADAVLARGGRPAFAPLSDELERASPGAQKAAEEALVHTSAALVEPFVALAKHPSADARARAVRFLSSRDEPKAKSALVAALHDADPTVLGAALDSFSADPDRLPIDAVTELAKESESWPVRARAAEALGALKKAPSEGRAISVLAGVTEKDSIAFVREAAVRALGAFGPAGKEALARVAARDAEPRIRALAKNLLEGSK